MRIHAILTGRVQIKEAQIEGRGHGLWRQIQPIVSSEWAEWVPVYAWAIEHPEGVIVVDTGSGAHLKSLPRWHPYFQLAVRFDIEPEQEVGPQLRSLGIGERDVKTVVLTHLHIDHDGGLAHFPQSRIFADSGEIARAAGIAGAIRGYLPRRWPQWFDPQPLPWQNLSCGPFARSAWIHAGWRRCRSTDARPYARSCLYLHRPHRSAGHARRRCVLSGRGDAQRNDRWREPGRERVENDARRHPRVVRHTPDGLSADARSAIRRKARRAPHGDRRTAR
jgi:Metallo-beta-lactamase superfamily